VSPAAQRLAAQRFQAQWLAGRDGADVAGVAGHVCGIQAQDTAAARLGIRARSTGTTAGDVRAASRDGSVVRTWLMRGTLHLVPAADVRWLLSVFGARNVAGGTRRRRELGLDERTCARALDVLPRILADENPLSRADLVDRLARHGVVIDPSGQAPAHLVGYAAGRAILCRGPDLARDEPGYVPLDGWVPAAPVPDAQAALAELTRRYLAAFGPASTADLAAWSGLPAGTARRGFALLDKEIVAVSEDRYVLAADPAPPGDRPPGVRLVGAFDTYLLGYRDRAAMLEPRFTKRIQAGGGIIHPAVLVDGRVAGTWRLRRAEVHVEPFEPVDPTALAEEAADLGRFLGTDVSLA
jgi:DNA glycosylase AlkZ-like